MARPNPDGWKGGSESFSYLRTFDGRLVPSDEDTSAVPNQEKNANAADFNDIFGGD